MLTRRAALVAPALIGMGHRAMAWTHGFTVPTPAVAAAAGYNTNTFYDDFNSLGSIDINNTGQPGFNWYRKAAWPNVSNPSNPNSGPWQTCLATAANKIAVANSVLTLSGDASGFGNVLSTACSAGASYNGKVFANGAYFEFSMGFDPALANSSFTSWPAGWAMGIPFLLGASNEFIEPDFFEPLPNNNIVNPRMALHDWDVTNNPSQNNQNSNTVMSVGSPDWTQLNVFGGLWIPASKNGGTGVLRRYFNGTHLTANDVSWTASGPASPGASPSNPNGTFSIWDDQSVMAILGCGNSWPASFGYYGIWQ